MKISELDYDLPDRLIADRPAQRRQDARMLVLDRARQGLTHTGVGLLPEWLRAGDLLVLNDTRVLAARVLTRKESGGAVEFLFVEEGGPDHPGWWAMAKPGRRLHSGLRCKVVTTEADGEGAEIEVVERRADGMVLVCPVGVPLSEIPAWLNRVGRMPLPPYIRKRRGREDSPEDLLLDRQRYQTVFAQEGAAVAAPTAGLHFTPELIAELDRRGVGTARVRLDVGPGTFLPVKSERLEDHPIHGEYYRVDAAAAARIRQARASGGRVIAVGTTSVRTLESAAAAILAGTGQEGVTELFITPGFRFQLVDGILTNFHLPRSTLLALVGAFSGLDRILAAYREAIRLEYRFYSYGDCMLLL